jgi:hypothetical protein
VPKDDPANIQLKAEPKTRTDRLIQLLIAYKNWVGGVVSLLAVAVMMRWIVIPIGIPQEAAILSIIALISAPAAYIGAKKLKRRYYNPDVDVIYELNGSETNAVRCYYMLSGEFLKQFEVKNDPLTWTNEKSQRCICVQSINEEERTAVGTWLGDIPDIELMKTREMWNDQRIRNDSLKEFSAQVFMKWDQITDTIEYKLTNQFLRMSYEVTQPEEVTAVFNSELPDMGDEGRTDAKNILEEVGIDTIKTMPSDERPESRNKEEGNGE